MLGYDCLPRQKKFRDDFGIRLKVISQTWGHLTKLGSYKELEPYDELGALLQIKGRVTNLGL